MRTIIRFIILFSTIVATLLPLSCDRMDDNGPFEGYWILVEREGYGEPLSTKSYITWGVRNELVQVVDTREAKYYYMTFKRTPQSLDLDQVSANDGSKDVLIDFKDIPAKFCIPDDGHFDIVTLNSREMVLRSSKATLRFKKN